MQRNRIINTSLIAVHSNEPTHGRIHIPRTEIVKSCYRVKLFAAEKEVILCTANTANKVAEYIIDILIRNLTAFVSKRTYRTVSVIDIVRLFTVTFLRNKLIATGIVTLFRVVKIISARTYVNSPFTSSRYFVYSPSELFAIRLPA